jgi:hypothetical protein
MNCGQLNIVHMTHRNKYMEGTFLRPHLAHQHKFISKNVGLSKNYIFRTKIFSPKIICKMMNVNIYWKFKTYFYKTGT